jgi:sRNA-binding protein
MNEKLNNEMEHLARLSDKQPELFAQLPAATKISLGIYQSTKTTANNGLSADELLRLRGLKQRIAQDILSPQERTVMALEILNLEEKNIGEIK